MHDTRPNQPRLPANGDQEFLRWKERRADFARHLSTLAWGLVAFFLGNFGLWAIRHADEYLARHWTW